MGTLGSKNSEAYDTGRVDPRDNNGQGEEMKRDWYFTFLPDHDHAGDFVVFYGTALSARKKMFDLFGSQWDMQYTREQFLEPDRFSRPLVRLTLKRRGDNDG